MQAETTEQTNNEPTIEEQAEAGKLGLFTEDTEEAEDGLQGQEEGQEEGRQEEQVEQAPRLSQVMEELARRDREVFEKSKALKEREAQLSQYAKLQELSKQDPDSVLKAYGIDPAEYVYQKYLAGDDKAEQPVKEPDPEVAQLKQQVQQLLSEKQTEQYQHAHSQGVESLRYHAEQMADELPLASKALSSQGGGVLAEQMLEAASLRYQQYGQIPTAQDLVTHVEPLLKDQAMGVLRDLWSVEKYRDEIKQIIGETSAPPKVRAEPPKRSATLSAKMGGDKAAPDARPMSEEEREAEFLRVMRKEGWRDLDDE